jgi:hypothetical protein
MSGILRTVNEVSQAPRQRHLARHPERKEFVVPKKHRPLPSLQVVSSLMTLDPSSKTWLRRIAFSGGSQAGAVAGGVRGRYFVVSVGDVQYQAHRIVYLLATGSDPGDLEIDHLDGDTFNNNPENLVAKSHVGNMNNHASRREGRKVNGVRSVLPGATPTNGGAWAAYFSSVYVGRFESEIEAHLWYRTLCDMEDSGVDHLEVIRHGRSKVPSPSYYSYTPLRNASKPWSVQRKINGVRYASDHATEDDAKRRVAELASLKTVEVL